MSRYHNNTKSPVAKATKAKSEQRKKNNIKTGTATNNVYNIDGSKHVNGKTWIDGHYRNNRSPNKTKDAPLCNSDNGVISKHDEVANTKDGIINDLGSIAGSFVGSATTTTLNSCTEAINSVSGLASVGAKIYETKKTNETAVKLKEIEAKITELLAKK